MKKKDDIKMKNIINNIVIIFLKMKELTHLSSHVARVPLAINTRDVDGFPFAIWSYILARSHSSSHQEPAEPIPSTIFLHSSHPPNKLSSSFFYILCKLCIRLSDPTLRLTTAEIILYY